MQMTNEWRNHHHQVLGKPWDTAFYLIFQKKSKSKDVMGEKGRVELEHLCSSIHT